jgi:hypothetical protein
MIKYRTWYNLSIEKVEIKKETEKQVHLLEGNIENKSSVDYRNYFDTFEEAKQFLLTREKTKRDKAANEIQKAAENISKIIEMKEEIK